MELLGKRIFIVEDNPMNIAVNSAILVRTGATVIQDPWNVQAIDRLRRALPVDVILLDLMLRNGISGYDIFEQIKADPKLRDIPVLAVSASDPTVEIPRAQSLGFTGFIGKPVNARLFPEQIAAAIDGISVWYSQHENLRGYSA